MPTFANPDIYTQEHIDAYRAVLHVEALRAGMDINNASQVGSFTMAAAGLNGKSALLDRISKGLRPFVVPPPVAMSYPWYSVVERGPQSPIQLWMEASDVKGLLEQGQQHREGLVASLTSAKEASEDKPLLSRASAFWRMLTDPQRQFVLIEQAHWEVLATRNMPDGRQALEVTHANWRDRGFVWLLSLDAVPAQESEQVLLSWHNPKIKRITTLEQLRAEQRWHVDRLVEGLIRAGDERLATEHVRQGRIKDLDAGGISRFYEFQAESDLAAKRRMRDARLAEGKTAIPDEAEITAMVQERLERHFSPKARSGSGWYSLAEDGSSLVQHTWRIRRIAPTVLPDDIYLDLSQLPPAPPQFLGDWRAAPQNHQNPRRPQNPEGIKNTAGA